MKVCFTGCSFTVGKGFPESQRANFIYDRLVSKKLGLDSDNCAIGGGSNYKIFMKSAAAVQSALYDLVVVQWTALNRLWLSPGPNSDFFTTDGRFPDFRYRDIYLSKSEKQIFRNTILLLNHDYQNIIDLIDYCKILSGLETSNTKVVFINGLVPWTDDLSKPLTDNLSECLSEYSKQMLDFDNRSNEEIIEFFTKLQQKFSELDQTKWVNLFDSFLEHTLQKYIPPK